MIWAVNVRRRSSTIGVLMSSTGWWRSILGGRVFSGQWSFLNCGSCAAPASRLVKAAAQVGNKRCRRDPPVVPGVNQLVKHVQIYISPGRQWETKADWRWRTLGTVFMKRSHTHLGPRGRPTRSTRKVTIRERESLQISITDCPPNRRRNCPWSARPDRHLRALLSRVRHLTL